MRKNARIQSRQDGIREVVEDGKPLVETVIGCAWATDFGIFALLKG
mgnify:CR=1 FL=1